MDHRITLLVFANTSRTSVEADTESVSLDLEDAKDDQREKTRFPNSSRIPVPHQSAAVVEIYKTRLNPTGHSKDGLSDPLVLTLE